MNAPNYTIREGDPLDLQVRALIDQLDAFNSALYPAESNHFDAPETLAGARGIFLVVEQDGELVGCGAAKNCGGWAELKRMYLKPKARGGGIALAISYYTLFQQLAVDTSVLLPWYAFTGFTVGVIGAIPFVMVKAFPAAVRFSGISFSYNVAYAIFGGLTPIVVSLMMKSNPMAPALYVEGLPPLPARVIFRPRPA